MKIPFAPPNIDKYSIKEVVKTLKSGWITTGPKNLELEDELKKIFEIENILAVSSATSGLMLCLDWYGVGPGDEVIIPAYTYAATALAVIHLGAKPVMVDSRKDFTINPQSIKKVLTENTKAIIPVDIAGLPCDYDSIRKIIFSKQTKNLFKARSVEQEKLKRILILSDSAHSIGSKYREKPAAHQSDFSVHSFHAVKNITTAEGGCIVINLPNKTNNLEIYRKLKLSSLNGQTKDAFAKSLSNNWKYDIVQKGFKANLPDVLAALALPALKKYNSKFLPKRKKLFNYYSKLFSNWEMAQKPTGQDTKRESSYHYYPLLLRNADEVLRDSIIARLSMCGISTNVHYRPLPSLKYFQDIGYLYENYKSAKNLYSREISFPIYPSLKFKEVKYIVKMAIEAYESAIQNKTT